MCIKTRSCSIGVIQGENDKDVIRNDNLIKDKMLRMRNYNKKNIEKDELATIDITHVYIWGLGW